MPRGANGSPNCSRLPVSTANAGTLICPGDRPAELGVDIAFILWAEWAHAKVTI